MLVRAPRAVLTNRALFVSTLHCRTASSCGLVGLSNVGKSTLHNALVKETVSLVDDRLFVTIDPKSASVSVPDPILDKIAALAGSARTVPLSLDVVDIAGLIAGASRGVGLGNAFLGDIRQTDAIIHVVRAFDGPTIHVADTIDSVRDISVIENELILADLASVERRMGKAGGRAARRPEDAALAGLLTRVTPLLEAGKPARLLVPKLDPADAALWPRLHLLSGKPCLFVLNVGEDETVSGNRHTAAVQAWLKERAATSGESSEVCIVSAKLEAELALLPDPAERASLLAAYGLESSGCDAIVRAAFQMMRTQVYYTLGPQEARAWLIPIGATAAVAASAIHSSFGSSFVKGEITSAEAYIASQGKAVPRTEGKAYVMAPGDIALWKTR